MSDLAELVDVLSKLKENREINKFEYYQPYEYQLAFHHAKDKVIYKVPFDLAPNDLPLATQRCLMAANQVGKTTCAAMETMFHLTGLYPEWWQGKRFDGPINAIVAGKRNETVRDVCQKELLGDPFDDHDFGKGAIPRDKIVKTYRKAGVPGAFTSVVVQHVSGRNSTALFMAFEQGPEAFMGKRFHVGWLDEEPPEDVWTQFIRGVLSRKNYTLYLTFTPEEGVTKVVENFTGDLKTGQSLIRATWDDAAHFTEDKKESFLAQLPPHEREMRSKGIPLMGSGVVFPVSDDDIRCSPFEIPKHFTRICGIDFGIDHPFAAVWLAYDRDADTIYVYDTYRISGALPSTHCSAIKARADWIPVVWPHDGERRDKGTGKALAQFYREEGLDRQMMMKPFSNPPEYGKEEGSGGIGIEAGITDLWQRMSTGRFKVFNHLSDWFEEKNGYHRKDGKIVNVRDDLMSATRYASQSLRHAITQPVQRARVVRKGVTNW